MSENITGGQFVGCLLTSILVGLSLGLTAGVCVAVFRVIAG